MNREQLERLEIMSGIGNMVQPKDKDTRATMQWGIIEDEVYIMVGDYKHLIQRMRYPEGATWSGKKDTYWDGSKYGYRTGYYTYDKNQTRIYWGQYTQFLTEREYQELLNKARAKGWPIF